MKDVAGIGRDHPETASAGEDDDRCVDYVGRRRGTAELTGCPRRCVVERDDHACGRAEKPDQSGLAGAIAPYLSDDAGGDEEGVPVVECPGDNADEPPVVAFELNQRPRVEYRVAHRPSARSASAFSSAVSGPPVSASISSSNAARSSSFVFCSKASATYALTLGARPSATA